MNTTDATAPYLVLFGAGHHAYRRYGLEHIAARHPVALLDAKPPRWAAEHVATAVAVDLTDRKAVTRVMRDLAADRGLAGVLTYTESRVVLAARMAGQFDLPGNSAASVAACRDKHVTRTLLAANGVPSARSVLAADEDSAVDQAGRIGFPVVVKPRGLGGSAGVHRADTPQQVRTAFQAAHDARLFGIETSGTPGGVLVEEYLDGPEISVECVVRGPGSLHIAAITRKHLGPEPAFQEIGHLVDPGDALLAGARIHDVALAALTAVGITRGVLHIEMRLTQDGPHIIEINARLGGDLIPHLVHLATGLNLPQITADLAVGAEPDLTRSQNQCAAVTFLYPTATGQVTSMRTGLHAPWLDRFEWTTKPGDHVTAPPNATLQDRLALAVVTGTTPDTCHRQLRLVEDFTSIHIRTAPTTTSCVA